MTYEVTATRKRPQTFDELVGQDFVVSTLKNSIEQGKIAHAYLFAGPRGVGKTSAARILAKSLNCEKGPTTIPCGKCSSCTEITRGISLDVIEIDGASNTGVNDIREIKDEVLFPPNSSRYKIYIIDEVHMLSNSAFNALLKTIEEPPPYIVFIFATTEIHKVPPTIRSRCQQYHFKQISIDLIKGKLEELVEETGIKHEGDALFWIAKEASGSLRDAYTIFDQVVSFSGGNLTMKNIKDTLGTVGADEINTLLGYAIHKDRKSLFDYLDKLLSSGISVEQFVIDLSEYFRSLLLLKSGIERESVLGFTAESFPPEIRNSYSSSQLEKILEELFKLYRNLRFSLNQRMELELLMSQIIQIEGLITPGELLEKIEEMKVKISKIASVEASQLNRSQILTASDTSKGRAEGKEEDLEEENADILDRIALTIKKEKPTVSSALEKAISGKLFGDTLQIVYATKDRFPAEMVKKERDLIGKVLNRLLGREIRVEIVFDSTRSEVDKTILDKRIETVKRIFRGEIVKGE